MRTGSGQERRVSCSHLIKCLIVVEQLGILKLRNPSEFEALRAKLETQTKCRVSHWDKAIDKESKDDDPILLVSWLLAALRNIGPYPLLILSSAQEPRGHEGS